MWDCSCRLALVWGKSMVYMFTLIGHCLTSSVLILSSLCLTGSWLNSVASNRACSTFSSTRVPAQEGHDYLEK